MNLTENPVHVLVVDDDPEVADAIREGLASLDASMDHVTTIAQGRQRLAQGGSFDAIILDRGLPDGDGVTLADACREAGMEIPILMVTAHDTVQDRVLGLKLGADDYICKPFAVDELIARLQSIMRRARTGQRHILRFHDIELDLVQRQVRRQTLERSLSAREVDLLAYLMTHPGEVLTKDRILQEVWGDECIGDSNVLHVYANYLRNKLEGGLYPRVIHTVRGVGYVLSIDEPNDRRG
ncbi:MAG: response regulator transcription factor [Phycisphaerae bacterium]